jgi:hypothetical protein
MVRTLDHQMVAEGLTGSLSSVDVNRSLEPRQEEFARCFDEVGRLRAIGGIARLQFRIDRRGRVLSVHPVDSTVGHRAVERCLVDVAAETEFPPPNGAGEATFTYQVALDPPEGVREPMTLDPSRVAAVVRRRSREVLQRCRPDGTDWGFQVTTYISTSGRVVSAGAAATCAEAAQNADCVVQAVRRWRMPAANRQAKVTFELR